MIIAPNVFISYARSPKRNQMVLDLAAKLRDRQLNVVVDEDVISPQGPEKGGWAKWMKQQISDADWVLMFFDEVYLRRFEGEEDPPNGVGVTWECLIIKNLLYRSAARNGKFIPLLEDGSSSALIPVELFGCSRYFIPSQCSELISKLRPAGALNYDGLLELEGYRVPFIPSLHPDGIIKNTFRLPNVSITPSSERYVLPKDFVSKIETEFTDLESCRLELHSRVQDRLEFTFSKIKYSDYLKSGEHLDDPLPTNRKRSFRDEFGQLVPRHQDVSFRTFALTNICGVGIFIVTKDNRVLVTRHSSKSHVYPRRWTFSASGTMRWGASPNPFTEALWKCRQEINHQVDLGQLELIEVGVDARKLFFECCFIERTAATSAEVADRIPKELQTEMIPLSPVGDVLTEIMNRCWEPAAEAVLIMLCIQSHGWEKTLKALKKHENEWERHRMLDEWDLRSSIPGTRAVTSLRYPVKTLEVVSSLYVGKMLSFMKTDIAGKTVLEVGSGTGRLTKRLSMICERVTCLDICAHMHERNRAQFTKQPDNVAFETTFIQDFKPHHRYDVAICSLVLIHNVSESSFSGAVEQICRLADVIFVFEDVTKNRITSPNTRLRSKDEIEKEFSKSGYKIMAEGGFNVFSDSIVSLKFGRQEKFKRAPRT